MAAASEVQENSDGKETSIESENAHTSKENALKLEDLKVNDLKSELEKRDLNKDGIKSDLVERLKTAMIERGENPEEYCFEISTNSTMITSPIKSEKEEIIDTNETIDTNDDLNNNEEKQEVALQLSIDEEEAQLNEESLIEITKQSDVETKKIDESKQLSKDVSAGENTVTDEQTTPLKAENENHQEKKIVKAPVVNKNAEINSVSPKVLKVVGKSDKLKSSTVLAKSLWITGLPNTTRAADLKDLFGKQGRVLSVKIVKSAKQTPSKCYGFITMATSRDATKAIQNLHRTELNGRVISVERKQSEPSTLLKKTESKAVTTKKVVVKKEVAASKQAPNEKKTVENESKDKPKIESSIDEKKSSESSVKKNEKVSSTEKSKDRKPREHKDRDKDSLRTTRRPAINRPRSFGFNDRSRYGTIRRPFSSQVAIGASFRPRSNILSLQRIREERFQRERLREKREAERRRIDEQTRHRYIERKQREEAFRLEREKERLRFERELLERERAEIIKLEREKQRIERERLEREREELMRHSELRRSIKRPFSRVDEALWDERKKSTSRYDVRPNLHADVPSSSRFEFTSRERGSFPARDRASFTSREQRTSFGREFERHTDRFNTHKHLEVLPRSDFADRDARREVTIRTREERQIFNRSDFRDRDSRRNFTSREPEQRNSTSRREVPRNDWKQDRRVNERLPSTGSSGQRRMNYY